MYARRMPFGDGGTHVGARGRASACRELPWRLWASWAVHVRSTHGAGTPGVLGLGDIGGVGHTSDFLPSLHLPQSRVRCEAERGPI